MPTWQDELIRGPRLTAAFKNVIYFRSHMEQLQSVVTSTKILIATFPQRTEKMKVLLQAFSSSVCDTG